MKRKMKKRKKAVDKSETPCYYVEVVRAQPQTTTKYARVGELVDSLDSGSSAHSGRGGSTPPSRTIRDRRKPVSFFASRALTERLKTPGFHAFSGIQGIFCTCWGIVAYLQVLRPIYTCLDGERAAVAVLEL